MQQKEHQLQKECVRWFRLQYPKYHWNLFSIPNGSKRNKITAIKLKAEGVLSGVSDLFLALPSKYYHGLFIEMKIKPNKPTPNQITFGDNITLSGYKWECVYTFDDFKILVDNWIENYQI